MPNLKRVSEQKLNEFLTAYPRKLEMDVANFCEPPVIQYNDFTLGVWPQSVVATKQEVWDDNYKPIGKWRCQVLDTEHGRKHGH